MMVQPQHLYALMIIMYYGNTSTTMQTMWAYMAATTGGAAKTVPEMP